MLALLLGVGLALLIVAVFPSTVDYDPLNPFWNGYSQFTSRFQVKVIDDVSSLDASKDILILLPYSPLSQQDLSIIKSFLEEGGRVLLMVDYGYGKETAEALGVHLEMPKAPLLDPLFNYRGPFTPKAFTHGRVDGVDSISLNYASAILEVPEDAVLAWSSSFSYLDLNLNNAYDAYEPQGPLPVAAVFHVGSGRLVVVSDASVAINSMIDVEGNEAFLSKLIDDREPALLVSTLPSTPMSQARRALWLIYSKILDARVVIMLLAAFAALAVINRGLRRR